MSYSTVSAGGPMERTIREKLTSSLNPSMLTIINESWKHRHHAAMRELNEVNDETHFSITVVSKAFQGKTMMQRHRIIYGVLATELQQGVHALSLQTNTSED